MTEKHPKSGRFLAFIIEREFKNMASVPWFMHRSAAVAAQAIELAIREGSFSANKIHNKIGNSPSQSTVTRILQQLESENWLEREADKSSLWRAGTKARFLGDMDEKAISSADRDPRTPEESSKDEKTSISSELDFSL